MVLRQEWAGLVQMQGQGQGHCWHSLREKPLEGDCQVVCCQEILVRAKAKRQSLALKALVQAPVKEKRQRRGPRALIWALAKENMKGRAGKLLVWALRVFASVPVMAKRKGRARRELVATPARALVQAPVKEKRKGGYLRGLAWVLRGLAWVLRGLAWVMRGLAWVLRGSGLWWEQEQK
jgi:hypothetical protein